MYPTLSDFIRDLTGVHIPLPIQSFGLILAISFFLAAYTLSLELKRKERQGLLQPVKKKHLKGAPATAFELGMAGIFGFILGYKLLLIVFNYTRFVDDTQGVMLSMEGSWPGGIALGALFAYMKYAEKKKEQLEKPEWVEELIHPYELVGNITMVAAVSGLLGAKVFHNLENLDEFAADPWGALFSFSGLTFYGGLICGAAGVIWYAMKNNIRPAHICDATAPGLMLAYAIGRLGCQISGDGDWGIVNNNPKPSFLQWLPDWAWAYNYPHNVNNVGIPIPGCEGKHCMMLPEPVYPTPLYELTIGLVIFFILWKLRHRIMIPGVLFCIYLIMNGVERFFIEQIRVNTTYHVLGREITQAEIISITLILAGVAGTVLLTRKSRNKNEAPSG